MKASTATPLLGTGQAVISSATQIAQRFATGIASGTVTALASGGSVSVQQIATDAFGNVLGEALAGRLIAPEAQGVGSSSGMQQKRGQV